MTRIFKPYYHFTLLFSVLSMSMMAQPKVIPLYPSGKVPNSKPSPIKEENSDAENAGTPFVFTMKVSVPDLTAYIPERSKATGIAVIICPGGGYMGLASHEGKDIAIRLNEAGIAGFVLKYRMPDPAWEENKEIAPLQDAQRAIQYVREHAGEWGIKPDHIGIMGSSAGGHLASTAATHYDREKIDNPKKTSLRPDFLILNYPVISFADSLTHIGSRYCLLGSKSQDELIKANPGKDIEKIMTEEPLAAEKIREYSNELQVTAKTPPTFINHAVDDEVVKIQNSLLFLAALKQNNVPAESFFYAKGGHGYGLNNPTARVQWIGTCIDWLKKINK
jgi:acetyl esterase/lipase